MLFLLKKTNSILYLFTMSFLSIEQLEFIFKYNELLFELIILLLILHNFSVGLIGLINEQLFVLKKLFEIEIILF